MYNYSIEQVENGEIVRVIALQTSAYAEQRNIENPLQFLVMSTIVTKMKIVLSWEEISKVDEYNVYRNGDFMATVKTNHFTDYKFSLDESYVYTILSKRALAKSEETLSKSKSVLATVFGVLNPVSNKEKAATEEFKVSKLIGKPNTLLIPVLEKQRRTNVNRWKFRYTTFLKEKWVINPNIVAMDHYFKGDDRNFDPEGKGFRTRVDIELTYDKPKTPLTFTKEIGQTVSYNRAKRFRQKAVASYDGIKLVRLDHGEQEVGFLLTHSVGNPLVKAPEIDYDVRAVMQRDGTFDITGFHDQAPHHEVYMSRGSKENWMPIQLAESKGLAWMSEITAWQYWRYSNFE
ncbi:DUF3238 domain-containing protein [Sporosarcina sp. FA9]|uniref:DUF3238 domain-containing protein n=1 Tax=Sporosarcina sp. FA9 TaxID=3413030 RepID=UPI003F658EEE